jgi:cytochrome P450
VSAIASCVLGLITHPEILKKAQAEIDTVVGLDQLPDFDYFDSLPFITAITKETLRWRDVVPIGELDLSDAQIVYQELRPAIPHLLTVDDIYNGYRLPAGTVVVPNAW